MTIDATFFGNLALVALLLIFGIPFVFFVTRSAFYMWSTMLKEIRDLIGR